MTEIKSIEPIVVCSGAWQMLVHATDPEVTWYHFHDKKEMTEYFNKQGITERNDGCLEIKRPKLTITSATPIIRPDISDYGFFEHGMSVLIHYKMATSKEFVSVVARLLAKFSDEGRGGLTTEEIIKRLT